MNISIHKVKILVGVLLGKTSYHERLEAGSNKNEQRYWGIMEVHNDFFLLNG